MAWSNIPYSDLLKMSFDTMSAMFFHRSSGPVVDGLRETPAELLHLAPRHFATGWSGKIVRGTYEGEGIVVKLAPTGSDRAEVRGDSSL